MVETQNAGGRKIRQRQDLHTVPQFEREMNDISAIDLYEQKLLECIRIAEDPNKKAVIEVYEGYVEPTFSAARAREAMAHHREMTKAIRAEREDIIRTLRSSEEHKALSAFEQLLIETEYYTGMREWTGQVEGPGSSQRPHSRLFRQPSASQNHNEDSMNFEMVHLSETPSYIRGKLRPYQIEGVNWLLGLFSRQVNGILADEMGLGKTFQTIATIAYLKYTMNIPGPHLVVCPKSVMGNWYREFRHWCPALSVYKFHATSEMRPSVIKSHLQPPDKLKYDVIVTTFEMILDELNAFRKIEWQYLIVDEAHKLKNEQGRAHNALASLHTTHRLIITGTPLQNNLRELWSLLHFLAPKLFQDADSFDAWFDTASGQQDTNVMENMHRILSPMMIRRLKADVSTGIPPKKEIYVSCKLTKKQREWYLHVLAKDAEALNKASGGSISTLSNTLMQLRKVINHPYLMDGAEEGPPFVTDEKIIRFSGKMIILDKLLHRLRNDVEGKHKVLIFSQFTSMLDIMEDYCRLRDIKYCRIDGNTNGYDRDSQMAAFNSPSGEYFVFLLSTRAGGLGINLQAANHVILYDSDWNPQMDLQAQDRAHRIGQKRSVRVYRFVTDGTLEEKMYRRALKKLYLDAVVVQQGRIQSKSANAASKEELLSMIKFGAEEIFKSRHEDVTEADIDRLLDEGEERSNLLSNEAKEQIQMSLASFQLGAEEANIYDFEGISFRSGEKTRTLHITLEEPISQTDLMAKCSEYGEVVKAVLHPNLKEALVHFRSISGAIDAKSHLPFKCTFAGRDSQTVVTSEMVVESLGAGERLGRGHRRREAVQFYTPEDVETMHTKVSKAPPLKLPRPPSFRPYHLFNVKRLLELHNTEVALMVRNWKRRYEKKSTKESTTTSEKKVENEEEVEEDKDKENVDEEEDDFKDEELTEIEKEEREQLMSEGFPNWSFQEYRAVVSALTSPDVDQQDYAAIAAFVGPEKTVGEVRDYVAALLERGEQCIKKFDAIEARIQKAREKRFQKEKTFRAARWKLESCEDPENQLTFKLKNTTSMDRTIYLKAFASGFNSDTVVGNTIRKLPEYRFNVWCQSRSEGFFERRLRTLVSAVKREWEASESGQEENQRFGARRRLDIL